MKKKYFVYAARVVPCELKLEAIFTKKESVEAYIKQEEAKLVNTAGMDLRYRVDEVIVEE